MYLELQSYLFIRYSVHIPFVWLLHVWCHMPFQKDVQASKQRCKTWSSNLQGLLFDQKEVEEKIKKKKASIIELDINKIL